MDKYKKLWKQLKTTITDEDILSLMDNYEHEMRKSRKAKYAIVLCHQPWISTYRKIQEMLINKVARHTIPKATETTFKQEFSEWCKALRSEEKTNEEMKKWLESKYTEFSAIRKDPSLKIKRFYTPSGFKRKIRSQLSEDELAAIVIDELIYKFEPKIPSGYTYELLNLDIEKYRQDWTQELWRWCWENRKTDANLKTLIDKYNSLTKNEYLFRHNHILSKMNRYIICYIIKLQYSCNNASKCYYTDVKYLTEEPYYNYVETSENEYDDLSIVDIDNTENDIINKLDDNKLVDTIMNYLENKYYKAKTTAEQKTWMLRKQVLCMRYGFNSQNRVYTLQEIGDKINLTRERIRQIEATTLHLIKQYLQEILPKNNNG